MTTGYGGNSPEDNRINQPITRLYFTLALKIRGDQDKDISRFNFKGYYRGTVDPRG